MRCKLPKSELRTPEQIREHYEIEKELANRLRHASGQERRHLYSSLYDELFRRVPHHPLLTRKISAIEQERAVKSQIKFLSSFLDRNITFLEIGPGDCALSFEVAKLVKQVYAVDVSNEITKTTKTPNNFQLVLSDGSSIPVPPSSINVAYSNSLMEHLHPDDAIMQLKNIYNALATGGVYICITQNRLSGPHDVSKYFDSIATGFHLKEYTTLELSNLFKTVGFSRIKVFFRVKGKFVSIPLFAIALFETLLDKLPQSLIEAVTRVLPFSLLPNIRLVGMR